MRTQQQAPPIEKCFQEMGKQNFETKNFFCWKSTKMLNALGRD